MAHTGHGHHIPGTSGEDFKPNSVARCGGIKMCPRCKKEVESAMPNRVVSMGTSNPGTEYNPVNPIEKAKKLVREHVDGNLSGSNVPPPDYEVYVYFFGYVLGGWKAELSTSIPNGAIYEVTYNADKKEAYLDEYVKVCNVVIQD